MLKSSFLQVIEEGLLKHFIHFLVCLLSICLLSTHSLQSVGPMSKWRCIRYCALVDTREIRVTFWWS